MSSKSEHTFVVLAYKESPFLEDCIKSVMNQQYNSDVVIATSTPNDFIDAIAKKYNLELVECVDYAYNQIKNRTGKMIDGSFVKDK